MLYHFNNVENRENDILASSIHRVELANLNYYSESSNRLNHRKNRLESSFSEKFLTIQENKKTISEVVFPAKSTCILIIYLLIFVSYLYIGALCFTAIELSTEKEDRSAFFKFRTEFLRNNPCIRDNDLEGFIKRVQELTSRGVSALGNASTSINNWDLTNAVFFATSLVTTIGYGNDKPVTVGGKIFCIIFVIFGIPMMMIMTTAVVERLFLLVDLLFSALFYKLQWIITENKFREIQIVSCFLILAVCFFIIPAVAFYEMEESNWTILDSLYFCVISLTTIGLGDLVPGESSDITKKKISKILATMYLFTGLLATSFCIRAFHRHENWNLGDKYIYLNNQIGPVQEYTISSSSTPSDSDSNRSSEQMQSYPIRTLLIKTDREKRKRYNSFS